MQIYLDVVVLINFLVDFFLLMGANRLAGYPTGPGRAAIAAGLGGIYSGACLLPGFQFLGNLLWRWVCLGLMGTVAFGFGRSTLRRSVLFVLLSMTLAGAALGLGTNTFFALAGAAAVICGLCIVGFCGSMEERHYVPVVLQWGERRVALAALYDTGNTLRDPVTGEGVLVAGAKIAEKLIGLSVKQLQEPLNTITKHPGLRLIPYRAVGRENGFLLGMRVENARIGKKQRSVVVAFAPEGLGSTGEYEALIGGAV